VQKFVARKARKFLAQDRLALPLLEMSYIFQGLQHAPGHLIIDKMLPEIDAALAALSADLTPPSPGTAPKSTAPKQKERAGHWDDYCLARFLQGVCLRYVAHPDPDAEVDPAERLAIGKADAEKRAEAAFRDVLAHGPRIELDHQIVYQTHYELGRLLACQGRTEDARKEFELVLSGQYLEVGPSGKKGKYSLENVLHVRTHAAVQALQERRL